MKTKFRPFKAVVVGALVLLCFFAFVFALGYGIDQQELVDCYGKQSQYAAAPILYSDWETENKSQAAIDDHMCEYHHIDIHAGTTTPPENRQ